MISRLLRLRVIFEITAPTSSCGRMTTIHERTQTVPPRPQMRGSRRSVLLLTHHCRWIGVVGVLLRRMPLPARESVSLCLR
jgi:hypothetical protein